MGSDLCIYCEQGLPTKGDFCDECGMPQTKFITVDGEKRFYRVTHDGENWISEYAVMGKPKNQQYYGRREGRR